jgi:S1-C subfamily serine protease/thiol-disulfide isomerase/thioredoxin
MVGIKVLLLSAWMSTGPSVEIVEFTSPQCSPCRQMEPVVRQLRQAGYPIRQVDVAENPSLANRFRVDHIPCFVILRDGSEVQRVDGVQTAGQLQALFRQAQGDQPRLEREGLVRTGLTAGPPSSQPQLAPTPFASGSHPGSLSAPGTLSAAPAGTTGAPYFDGHPAGPPALSAGPPAFASSDMRAAEPNPIGAPSPAAAPASGVASTAADVQQQTLLSSVRLRVEDAGGQSFGTGTIIDVHGQEALVLTCGHIFRESQGGGRILVDMADGSGQDLPGRIISYDLNRDVGLISFQAPGRVTVARVGGSGHAVRAGEVVYSIGCDRGAPPTVNVGQVTAINKFLGPENLTVSGQPVDGRSGGGLFDARGTLIGVCNAADPQDNEGLYAALASIHAELDRANLGFVYQGSGRSEVSPLASAPTAGSMPTAAAPQLEPVAPEATPTSASNTLAQNTVGLGDAEVVCVVRSRTDPQSKSRVIVLDRPSREFLERLEWERTSQSGRQATDWRPGNGAH